MSKAKRGLMSIVASRKLLWFGFCLGALASSLSCNPVYCVTANGMEFLGTENGSSITPDPVEWCRSRADQEQIMVDYMGHGENLKGYQIVFHNVGSWKDPWGRMVGGYTTCATKNMHVGTGTSAFAHEVAHALQSCQPPLPIDPGTDINHSDWYRDGIFFYIDKATQ